MLASVKRFQIMVTAESPVRVGGSRDPVRGVDLPMATVAGRPVIPGASFKGALRAELGSYLLGLAKASSELRPCIPAAQPSQQEKELVGQGFRPKACSVQEEAGEGKRETICPACYLLGAQGLVGFVSVPFLYAAVGQEDLVEIAIDGASGTTRSGSLRSLEFVGTKATFSGVLEVVLRDPVRGWKLGLPRPQFSREDQWVADGSWPAERIEKELVLDRLEAIKRLGGFKSKGYGRVSVKVTEIL